MDQLLQVLKTRPVAYVSRDIERALGLPLPTPGFFIITNSTEVSEALSEISQKTIHTIKASELLDTYDILTRAETLQFLISRNIKDIVVFQNTGRIERWAIENKINIINPSSSLAKTVEEKISQIEWLGDDAQLLPPHSVLPLKDVTWGGKKFVLQFNRSHTGEGTYVIEDEEKLSTLKSQFPERPVRIVEFVTGSMFTVNIVVSPEGIHTGNPSLQITGLVPFTDLPYATVGNDWSYAQSLPNEVRAQLEHIGIVVGERMKKSGWKGLFGIDAIVNVRDQKVYLIEINARQPASTTFESALERQSKRVGITVFEAHLFALLGIPVTQKLISPIEGAQIVQRITSSFKNITKKESTIERLRAESLAVLPYENTELNRDALRIQSLLGLMETPNALNAIGIRIRDIIHTHE